MSAADLVWRPLSDPPKGMGPYVSVLILSPPDDGGFRCLDPQIYTWDEKRRVFSGDEDDAPPMAGSMWLSERAVCDDLPRVQT